LLAAVTMLALAATGHGSYRRTRLTAAASAALIILDAALHLADDAGRPREPDPHRGHARAMPRLLTR